MFLEVVRKWTEAVEESQLGVESTLSEVITSWTAVQDRGGLIHCSPKLYHFMKEVNRKVRGHLSAEALPTFAGKNIIPIIAKDIKCCPAIQELFKSLIGCDILSETLCEALFDEILVTWIATKSLSSFEKVHF